jgi:hypothetical protein
MIILEFFFVFNFEFIIKSISLRSFECLTKREACNSSKVKVMSCRICR